MALTLDGTSGIVSSGAISSSSNITATGSITTQSSTGIIFSDSSNQGAAASPFSLKNRIINGDMVIDQRNNGASVTQSTSVVYTVDRWSCFGSAASKFTVQRNAGSVTPPAGFTNYLGVTSSSAYTVGASEFFFVQQVIEGFNIADLAWGTANAATVTLSFWVRSSLTGTFGGTLSNGATNRVYPFIYTISSANTWTRISITVSGDTSGTWATDNTGGLVVNFNMGAGASVSGTAGTWSGSTLRAPTGATSVVGTNGATWYITGVQLERNTTATPFEWIPYTTELQLCQRYFEKSYNQGTAIGAATATAQILAVPVLNFSSNAYTQAIYYKVNKRSTPTVTAYAYNGTSGQWHTGVIGSNEQLGNVTVINSSESAFSFTIAYTVTPTGAYGHYIASAEL